MIKTKSILKSLFILIVVCLFSCSDNEPNYTYKWELDVVYTNGDTDIINCQYNSFNGNECTLVFSIFESSSCLVMYCGLRSKSVACGVRKYKVVSLNKILLK